MKSLRYLLAVLLVLPAAAEAQVSWGRSDDFTVRNEPRDLRMMHEYAACLAERRTEEAERVLAMDFLTEDYDKALRRLALRHHGCMPKFQRARFTGTLLAGGLAEALLEADSGEDLAGKVAFDPAAAPIQARSETEAMTLCTVRSNPGLVADILATEPASPEESAAMKAIAPELSKCLGSGTQARMNRPAVRSLLALAAYRLSQHNAAAPAAGK